MDGFGSAVKRRRVLSGLTQEGLARECGLTFGTVNEIENGKRKPQLGTAVAIASALGVTIDALLDESAESAEGAA